MPKRKSNPVRRKREANHKREPIASRSHLRNADPSHALVGGWTQRRGKFVSLLLGIRKGRRRKLEFVGEVKTPEGVLVMTFLEDQLRQAETEDSPFVDDVPSSGAVSRHWTAPELVAEIDFPGWTKDTKIAQASLRTVAERASFRNVRWLEPPE